MATRVVSALIFSVPIAIVGVTFYLTIHYNWRQLSKTRLWLTVAIATIVYFAFMVLGWGSR